MDKTKCLFHYFLLNRPPIKLHKITQIINVPLKYTVMTHLFEITWKCNFKILSKGYSIIHYRFIMMFIVYTPL